MARVCSTARRRPRMSSAGRRATRGGGSRRGWVSRFILERRARWCERVRGAGDAVFDVDPKALRASRAAIQAWAELGVIMFLFWFWRRRGWERDAKKSYDRDLMLSIFAALGAYGWRVTPKESRTTSSLYRE